MFWHIDFDVRGSLVSILIAFDRDSIDISRRINLYACAPVGFLEVDLGYLWTHDNSFSYGLLENSRRNIRDSGCTSYTIRADRNRS